MDENSKQGGDGGAAKLISENAVVENPNTATNGAVTSAGDAAIGAADSQASSRTPFTNLSQVEADQALARTLQEQERAYMMLTMNGGRSWEEEYYYEDGDYDDPDGDEYDGIDEDQEDQDEHDINLDDDEDSENDDDIEDNESDDEEDDDTSNVHDGADSEGSDVPTVEVDPAAYPDDESYARALQDAEEREMAARLLAMAGITEREDEDLEDDGGNSQEAWEEVDPDELSYEELIALGEVVGTESRGLSADTIASLPSYIRCPISTICMGQAASMGSLLLAAGAKGERKSLPNASVMIHQPSGGYSGQAKDLTIHTKQIVRVWDSLNALYAKHTGQPVDVVEKNMDRDNFMTPTEAKEFGLIDEVIDRRPLALVSDAIETMSGVNDKPSD